MKKIVRYFRVSPLPHLTASIAFAVALLFAETALVFLAAERLAWSGIFGFLFCGWVFGSVCCLLDAASRFREYQRLKYMFLRYGPRPRILNIVADSRCQRDAAMQAARESGYVLQAKGYFRNKGYRWYHILPDRIVTNPFTFFHPDFLRTTFLPGKRCRYEFSES